MIELCDKINKQVGRTIAEYWTNPETGRTVVRVGGLNYMTPFTEWCKKNIDNVLNIEFKNYVLNILIK